MDVKIIEKFEEELNRNKRVSSLQLQYAISKRA